MTQTQRLKEYGMYIRRTAEGTYNLGWMFAQRRGGIANFPTYDDAYNAFEGIIDAYWEFRTDDFQEYVEAATYQG